MAEDERRYQQLVDRYRSGQISAAQWEMHLKETPGLLAFTRKNTRGAPAPAAVEAGLASSAAVTMQDKLACARRELAMRRNVYPKQVASGRMKQEKADREIEVMAAIVTDLALDLGATAAVHDAALEEAAKLADEWAKSGYAGLSVPANIAAEIRAMKVMP